MLTQRCWYKYRDNFDTTLGSTGGSKTCSICDKRLTKRDYLTHFKVSFRRL